MRTNWYLYHFDFERYLELRPLLGRATDPTWIEPLVRDAETQTIYDELIEGAITLEIARHAMVETQCCVGEPLVFSKEIPLLVSSLGKHKEGTEAATILSELLSGGHNLDKWLLPPRKTYGFLKPSETTELAESLLYYLKKRRRKRQHGLFRTIYRMLLVLFDAPPSSRDTLEHLTPFVVEAMENGLGIAVVIA